jgi:signal transduction histidine kinase
LKQVLMNLLSNAVKYTAADGQVNTTVEMVNGNVEVAVQDSGRGIPEADLPHLFEKFYRVQDSEGWATGTGLGLSIVKEIIEAHGGRISVASQWGVGTTFTFSIPAAIPS